MVSQSNLPWRFVYGFFLMRDFQCLPIPSVFGLTVECVFTERDADGYRFVAQNKEGPLFNGPHGKLKEFCILFETVVWNLKFHGRKIRRGYQNTPALLSEDISSALRETKAIVSLSETMHLNMDEDDIVGVTSTITVPLNIPYGREMRVIQMSSIRDLLYFYFYIGNYVRF